MKTPTSYVDLAAISSLDFVALRHLASAGKITFLAPHASGKTYAPLPEPTEPSPGFSGEKAIA